MATFELVLVLILAVALVAFAARFVPVPLPLLLIATGGVFSAIPALAKLSIDPAVFFALFIPPLLYADGWLMPRRDLKGVLRPVLALAFGLVLVTVITVGYVIHALVPAMPLAAAFALGAIVSPTDAVATAAMTQKLPLPRRVTMILNGESLINDASGLVAFKFAVAALATGAFSLADAGLQLVLVAAGGAVIGLAVAYIAGKTHSAIARSTDPVPFVHTMLSLLTPFAAYFAAEAVEVSGILAVVASGLYSGWRDARHMGVEIRQNSMHVWSMLVFTFNGLVFLLLGLALPRAIAVLAERHDWLYLAVQAVVLWGIVTLVRLVWVYPGTYLPPLLFPSIEQREGTKSPREVFIVGWAGLRGSVTMAAALSLPVLTSAGADFPARAEVIFLAATTIVLTLLINGLTLPPLIRALKLRGDGEAERELAVAQIALARAGSAALKAALPTLPDSGARRFAETFIEQYDARGELFEATGEDRRKLESYFLEHRRIVMIALEAERQELRKLLDDGAINDETARTLEPRIDYLELYATGPARETGH